MNGKPRLIAAADVLIQEPQGVDLRALVFLLQA
jgi:hypothetical protein